MTTSAHRRGNFLTRGVRGFGYDLGRLAAKIGNTEASSPLPGLVSQRTRSNLWYGIARRLGVNPQEVRGTVPGLLDRENR